MELKQCLECMLYKTEVCGISCKDQNVVCDNWCIEKLQELNRALYQRLNQERSTTEAAVKDLSLVESCKTCGNRTPFCDSNPDACDGYKWRGPAPQKEEKTNAEPVKAANPDLLQEAKNLIARLTEAVENGTMSEKKPEEKTYLDMVTDLYAALDSDPSIPEREKDAVLRNLELIKAILWKYSA